MVNFFIYDITFMLVFSIFIAIFLVRHKKAVKREGIMFLYRTKVGIKAINYFGDNFKKLLHKMKYVIIPLGFFLMSGILYMLGRTLFTYVLHPEITDLIKAPPIAPLIPYFPKIFNMESFFPPFYFTYFILALAVVAIVHEFSHGIFMRAFKIKIKSTGIAFLGPILGAFVEQDDRSMKKKKNSEQMTVMAAGVFMNLVAAFIFYILYFIFFVTSFTASGYIFNSYSVSTVPVENITGIYNMTNGMIRLETTKGNYYLDEGLSSQLKISDVDLIIAYDDAPAILAEMKGAIIQANDVKIINQDSLREFMQKSNPEDEVIFITEDEEGIVQKYNITLATHPNKSSEIGYLGVGNSLSSSKGIVQKTLSKFMYFKEPSTYYKPKFESAKFIVDLFWWIMLINLLVAMFNMLPLGILDGGRFFYLAMLSIFKKEKTAKIMSKIMKNLIIITLILMMVYWLVGILR